MNPWSIREGGATAGQGYVSATTGNKRPTYWHYQLVASNFKGSFLPNILGNSGNYKAFAYKNAAANEIGVLLLNQDLQSPRGSDNTTESVYIDFNSGTPTSGIMNFSFAAANTMIGTSGVYNCTMLKESTMLLVFDITTGALKKRQTYSLKDALRTTDTGTYTDVNNSTEYNGWTSTDVKSDILIGTNTATTITAGANQDFKATNSIQLNGPYSSGSSGAYKTLVLEISTVCP